MANISLRPLSPEDIDAEYTSWYQNNDGHLDFLLGATAASLKRYWKMILRKGPLLKNGFTS